MFDEFGFNMYPLGAFEPKAGRMRLLGGKGGGSSAPPPDPRLVEAQIRSMGIQDASIQGILGLQRELQPLQREQMQFGLDSGRKAFDQSQSDREYSLGRRAVLTQQQDAIANEAKTFNTQDKQNELADTATADVNQAFSAAQASQGRNMARMGINPNSGRYGAASNGMAIAQAAAQAQGANGARTQARAEGRMLTDRAANALSGFPAMSMQATGAGAQYAGNGINIANAGLNGMSSGFGTAANIAGQMGTNATSMYGSQANYKLGADKQAADNDPWASILGAGVKLGTTAMMASDRRLKANITQTGVDSATGLPIYQFNYIADPARTFTGVMSDDVRAFMPQAVWVGADGYDQVNYALLGIDMREVTP